VTSIVILTDFVVPKAAAYSGWFDQLALTLVLSDSMVIRDHKILVDQKPGAVSPPIDDNRAGTCNSARLKNSSILRTTHLTSSYGLQRILA
jgi:hypothetical protein